MAYQRTPGTSLTLPQFTPADSGYLAWAFDPACCTGGTLIVGGTLTMIRLNAPQGVTFSNIHFNLAAAGVTLTNVGVGVYDAAGALVTASVNANGATTTAFQSTGFRAVTTSSPVSIAGGFYIGIWAVGTTLPSLMRGGGNGGIHNGRLAIASGTGLRFAVANTGLTDTAPTTAVQTTGAAASFWTAVW